MPFNHTPFHYSDPCNINCSYQPTWLGVSNVIMFASVLQVQINDIRSEHS